MSKLTPVQKELRKELRALYDDVRFVACKESGVTLVRCKHPGGRFDRVAIAYCGPQDTFSRKRGEYEALCKLESDQFILVQRGQLLAMVTNAETTVHTD